jgi:hypothetical protein
MMHPVHHQAVLTRCHHSLATWQHGSLKRTGEAGRHVCMRATEPAETGMQHLAAYTEQQKDVSAISVS